MLSRGLACLGLAALLAPPLSGAAEYIRDEVRINLRSGPGQQFRVLRLLRSGTELSRLGEDDGWLHVSVADGEEGWVPQAYVTSEIPPSVVLPGIRVELEVAQSRIGELEAGLAAQAEAVEELGWLRARTDELEKRNQQLAWSEAWKKWLAGAAIAALFLLIGTAWPRGGPQQGRRIKL